MTQFLTGEKIFFRTLEKEDYAYIHAWMNDPLTTYFLFYGQTPASLDAITDIISSQVSHGDTVFIIADKKTGEPVGFTGLHDIHSRSRKAEFRIFIGEKSFRGKGIGTEATEMMVYYGFDRLNLHRIYLGFTSHNESARHCYENAGFKEEGLLKDDIYRNSRYYDSVRMAMVRDDYYENFFKSHEKRFGIQQQ